MRKRLFILSGVLLSSVAVPTSAYGASLGINNEGPTFFYEAGTGFANHLTITVAADHVTFTDHAETIDDNTSSVCSGGGTSTMVCPVPTAVVVRLYDLNDDLSITGLPLPAGAVAAIDGGAGADTLIAGPEDDSFVAADGDGDDVMDAGAGTDTIFAGSLTQPVHLTLGAAATSGNGVPGENDTLAGIENAYDTLGSDVITGGAEQNRVEVTGGADVVSTGGGNDTISGNNTVGDTGANTLDGGPGDDTISWSSLPGETVHGGPGDDELTAVLDRGGPAIVFGDDGDDAITGSGSGDLIVGGNGSDIVSGLGGNDVIDGGAGSDQLDGDLGADTIAGGAGIDSISGGAGPDVIRATDNERDQVLCGGGEDAADGDLIDSLAADCETVSGTGVPQGGAGTPGPAGLPGPAAPLPVLPFVAVAVDKRLTGMPGRKIKLRYVVAAASAVTLVIKKGPKTIATILRTAKPGINTIAWNGRVGKKKARPGTYSMTLTVVTTSGATKTLRSTARLHKP